MVMREGRETENGFELEREREGKEREQRGKENGSNGSCEDGKWARERTVQGTDWGRGKKMTGICRKR